MKKAEKLTGIAMGLAELLTLDLRKPEVDEQNTEDGAIEFDMSNGQYSLGNQKRPLIYDAQGNPYKTNKPQGGQ